MTRFLLCRHGSTDAVGRVLVGRSPGIPLNRRGRAEALALSTRLRGERVAAVYSSPLERALETARTIAAPHALDVSVREELTDFDFGSWTGATIADLEGLPEFQRFNGQRSFHRAPGGEHALEVQARMLGVLESLARDFPHATLALVSHADPLKAVIGHFLGVPIDLLSRLAVDTGSLSVLDLGPDYVIVRSVNTSPE